MEVGRETSLSMLIKKTNYGIKQEGKANGGALAALALACASVVNSSVLVAAHRDQPNCPSYPSFRAEIHSAAVAELPSGLTPRDLIGQATLQPAWSRLGHVCRADLVVVRSASR